GSERDNPLTDFETINAELTGFSEKLMKRIQIVALNKIDMLPLTDEEIMALSMEEVEELGDSVIINYRKFIDYLETHDYEYYKISAAAEIGVKPLIDAASRTLDVIHATDPYGEDFSKFEAEPIEILPVELDPDYKIINIFEDEDGFVLEGLQLKKIFDSTNFNDYGSLRYLYKYIKDAGTIDQLKEMGLEDGDTIKIFDYEMEYEDEE
ncbi:MAG: Obg family GTPase CgtA, partial [Clostridiales Family XIII bacterium]|nr:Obg family GTPase CgtA [Clostridiales Family XIII bacterium]